MTSSTPSTVDKIKLLLSRIEKLSDDALNEMLGMLTPEEKKLLLKLALRHNPKLAGRIASKLMRS